MSSRILNLQCPECNREFSADRIVGCCTCGSPLLARYDTDSLREDVSSHNFPSSVNSMWRYAQLLPVRSPSSVVSLGEGWTPMLDSRELVKQFGMGRILIKDESRNPTFSFKDRGLCVAISKHIELGGRSFALPSAGNAAVSMSAYCPRQESRHTSSCPLTRLLCSSGSVRCMVQTQWAFRARLQILVRV